MRVLCFGGNGRFRNRTRCSRNRMYNSTRAARGKMPILFERALLLPAGSAELHRKYGERTERAGRGTARPGADQVKSEPYYYRRSSCSRRVTRPRSLLTLIAGANINSFPYRRERGVSHARTSVSYRNRTICVGFTERFVSIIPLNPRERGNLIARRDLKRSLESISWLRLSQS